MTKLKTRRGIAPGANLPPTDLDLSTPSANVRRFPVSTITVDEGIQQRALGVDQKLVADYSTDIADWIDVAPVIVYSDGETHWLADGFHRIAAAVRAGLVDVPASVYDGDRRKAILYAVRANQQHGLRRNNADKRRAVETLLRDPEWSIDTDNRIAAMAGVSQPFVSKMRAQLITVINCEPEQPAVQLETVTTCEPEAESPAEPEVVIEELPGDDMDGVRAATARLREATQQPEQTEPEPTKPEKRRGRDGKLYPAPKPKPKPRGDHNKPRVAMKAAHAVTAALNALIEVEADLLDSDALTLMANLTKALERLGARFPVATKPVETTEGKVDA